MTNTPEYDHEEKYKGYFIKQFPFLKSSGGVVKSDEVVEVQYYHYHVFADGVSAPLEEFASRDLARQYIDTLDN